MQLLHFIMTSGSTDADHYQHQLKKAHSDYDFGMKLCQSKLDSIETLIADGEQNTKAKSETFNKATELRTEIEITVKKWQHKLKQSLIEEKEAGIQAKKTQAYTKAKLIDLRKSIQIIQEDMNRLADILVFELSQIESMFIKCKDDMLYIYIICIVNTQSEQPLNNQSAQSLNNQLVQLSQGESGLEQGMINLFFYDT